jgi:hypothetical protein
MTVSRYRAVYGESGSITKGAGHRNALADGRAPALLGDREEPVPVVAVNHGSAGPAVGFGRSTSRERVQVPVDRSSRRDAEIEDRSGVAAAFFLAVRHRRFAPAWQSGVVRSSVRPAILRRDGQLGAKGAIRGEDGRQQVFVRPFPNVDAARTQVSTRGGSQPVWARNGRELFYLAPDGALMSVPVNTGATPAVAPSRVFQQTYFDGAGLTAPRTYDVSPDGHRFLMIKAAAAEPSIPVRMVVVLNWFEELTRAVPPR